jgi:asparagine synthase (glutamine-hydrolysing)
VLPIRCSEHLNNMCGIFGAVKTKGWFVQADYEHFCRLNNMTSYRGPDDHGTQSLRLKACTDDGADVFDVFLGNRRLSILDLSSNGHQPMTDGEGHWIAYNGEIFNYLELRRELQEKGHEFRTNTDTEVILHLYKEYGESGFGRLNGMWAFAIADIPNSRLILSRDRFSIKPLYLLRSPDCIYFASELKQLLPLLHTRRINWRTMSVFLLQGLLDHSPATFFEDIVKAAPRTNIVIALNSGEVRDQVYWDFPCAERISSLQDAVDQFRELFLDSIKLRLRSDVKVGVLLSGGLDSSAIAVGCKEINDDHLETYSIVSEDGLYDERRFIDALANTGIRNRKIVFNCTDVMQNLDRVLEHCDEPVGGFSVVAQFKLFEAIKQHTDVTVLLSGQGGDEVLLGYLKFFFFHLRTLYRRHNYSQAILQLCASLWQRTVAYQFRLKTARRYIPSLAPGLASAIRLRHSSIPVWECADVRSRQISDIEKYSVPALTHYEDRNSMAHSLEVRHPFLDHRLVGFLVNLPPEWKIRNGWTKHVLRQAFPELPDAIRWRRDKQGFLTPEQHWLKHDLNGVIRDTFRNSHLAQAGILNDQAFLTYYDQFQKNALISESDIARIFIAERWMQHALSSTPQSLTA